LYLTALFFCGEYLNFVCSIFFLAGNILLKHL
jgi:hypothetical protein